MIRLFITHPFFELTSMIRRTAFHCGLWITLAFTLSGQLTAAEWQSVSFPTPGFNADGFTCMISTLRQENVGYMPVRVQATAPRGTFSGDRRLRLSINGTNGGNWPTPQTEYLIELELKANTSVYDETYYIPKYFEGKSFTFSFADVDGPLPGYRGSITGSNLPLHSLQITTQDVRKHIAIITLPLSQWRKPTEASWQAFPDLRTIDSMVAPDSRYLFQQPFLPLDRNAAIRYLESESPQCEQVLPIDEAFTNWTAYESFDVVIVAYPILETMRSTYPERFAALRKWVSSGGVLWTHAAPSRAEIADFFDVIPFDLSYFDPASIQSVASSRYDLSAVYDASQDATQWMSLLNSRNINPNRRVQQPPMALQQRLQSNQHPVIEDALDKDLIAQTDLVPVEAGKVIGIHLDDPYPGSWKFWYTVEYLSARNQVWQFRRGMSPIHGTSNFWDWLLDKVARPPVYPFLGVLTVFVLLVGPVAYYFTRKAGRTYLMFLFAPVLATVATLALFGYGFIADGFGTHCRLRQITWADGKSRRATTMSRASYFTAFYKREGLEFPDDVAVYPMTDPFSAFQRQRENQTRVQRAIEIGNGKQRFQGDFFPARNQRQFLSFDPNIESQSIQINDAGDGQLQLTNQFQQTVQRLLYRDTDGQYWELSPGPCPSGESATLGKLSPNEHQRRLRQLYLETQPAPPPGYAVNASNYMYRDWLARLQSAQRFQNALWKEAGDSMGVFEAFLQKLLVNSNELPRGWYVAIADIDPRGLAYPDADLSDSVHFIMGSAE